MDEQHRASGAREDMRVREALENLAFDEARLRRVIVTVDEMLHAGQRRQCGEIPHVSEHPHSIMRGDPRPPRTGNRLIHLISGSEASGFRIAAAPKVHVRDEELGQLELQSV